VTVGSRRIGGDTPRQPTSSAALTTSAIRATAAALLGHGPDTLMRIYAQPCPSCSIMRRVGPFKIADSTNVNDIGDNQILRLK
jgi:hypothetical protein